MCLIYYLTIYAICISAVAVLDQDDFNLNTLEYNGQFIDFEEFDKYLVQPKISVKLYYECFCPGCRYTFTNKLKPAIEKLHQYIDDLDIQLYPYGNAKTIIKDGNITVVCQHGPEECYGNKLHACALDRLNITSAIFYNACLMESARTDSGSDDAAADLCGKQLGINSKPIKKCAKGDRGEALLEYYGKESVKVGYKYVPYDLINGKESDDLWKDICAAFPQPPPPPCQNSSYTPPQV